MSKILTIGVLAGLGLGVAVYAFADHRALTIRLRDLLVRTAKVLNNGRVNYFVCFGTLLGLIRQKDLIPNDEDLDICIPESERSKIMDLKAQFAQKGIIVENIAYQLLRLRDARHSECYCDVYVLDGPDENGKMGRAYWGQIDPAVVFDHSVVYPTKEMILPFTTIDQSKVARSDNIQKEDDIQTITIPGNSIVMLETIYGKDWKTPKRGYKGVSTDNLKSDIWRLASPFLLSTRLGFYQISHGK